MKAHTVIHGRTHGPGGSDPIPELLYAHLKGGYYNGGAQVPATTTVTVDTWSSGYQLVDTDPYPPDVDYIRISRPGLYLVQAEAFSYNTPTSMLTPMLDWYDDDDILIDSQLIFVGAIGDMTRTGEASDQHRFWSICQFWVTTSAPGTATHGRLRLDFYNDDASSRNFGEASMTVVRLAASIPSVEGPGWTP